MELGLKENPNVRQHSITIPGAGDSGVSEVTPGIVYPLLVSKKRHQKFQIIHLMDLTFLCSAGQIVGNIYLGVIYWEAVEGKQKSPNSTISYSQLLFRPFWGKPLDGKWSCGNSACAGTQHPAGLPGREGREKNCPQHPVEPHPV